MICVQSDSFGNEGTISRPSDGYNDGTVSRSIKLGLIRQSTKKSMESKLEQNRDVFRAVAPAKLLWRFGYWIRSGPTPTMTNIGVDDMCTTTVLVNELSQFISHSWHDDPMSKTIALFAYFNGAPAVAVGCAVAVLLMLLWHFAIIPDWNSHANLECVLALLPELQPAQDAITYAYAGWGTVGYSIGYIFVLLFWQNVAGYVRKDGLFFDKLCIHQNNQQQKMLAIDNIGGFLLHSRSIVILWGETYHERLWCIFELAVYLALRPTGTIYFIPISIASKEVEMTVALCIFGLAFSVVYAIGIPQMIMALFPQPGLSYFGIFCSIFSVVVCPVVLLGMTQIRMEIRVQEEAADALSMFNVRDVNCKEESDRDFVYGIIDRLYGDQQSFEEDVKQRIQPFMAMQVASVPYRLIVRVCIPMFIALSEIIIHLWHEDPSLVIHFLVGIFSYFAMAIPVLVRMWVCLARFRLSYRGRSEECFICVVLSIIGTGSLSLSLLLLRVLVNDKLMIKTIMSSSLFLILVVLWRNRIRVALRQYIRSQNQRAGIAPDGPSPDIFGVQDQQFHGAKGDHAAYNESVSDDSELEEWI